MASVAAASLSDRQWEREEREDCFPLRRLLLLLQTVRGGAKRRSVSVTIGTAAAAAASGVAAGDRGEKGRKETMDSAGNARFGAAKRRKHVVNAALLKARYSREIPTPYNKNMMYPLLNVVRLLVLPFRVKFAS